MSDYRVNDQLEKLGPPPWSPDDPKVQAWESAHGHDVRLDCYPEYGCAVEREALEAEVERMKPVYEAALEAFNSDSDSQETWEVLIAAVRAARDDA